MAGRRGINGLARRVAGQAAGQVAAWLVAYVLVLQSVLTGFALGAMPTAPDAEHLCLGATSSTADTDDGRDSGAPQHSHCQACLARADLPALPPPPPVPAIAPLTGALRLDLAAPEAFRLFHVLSAFQARAPPVPA